MPRSKMEVKPTPRPGLHKNSMSPPSGGRKSTYTRCRANDEPSPVCLMTDDISNIDESKGDSCDDVDHSTPRRSRRLYPEIPLSDLSDDSPLSQNCSPTSKSDFCSPNDSYLSAYSQCHSRTGPQSLRKEVPDTSETGSPGKKFSPESEAHSQCHLRTVPQSLREEVPVTSEKGSPGKRVHHESVNTNTLQQNRGKVVVVIFCFSLILISLSVSFLSKENVEQHTKPIPRIKPIKEVHEDFKKELRRMIQEFSQPRNFWVQLMAQIDSIMVDSPTQPAVILAVVPEDARGTAVCLLHKIARAVMYAFEDSRFVMHDVSDARQNHHSLKLEIDEALKGLSEAHAAVIHNIENIPGDAAMIFHAYCDNENAPYKQALLLPVIEVQGYYEDLAFDRLDNTVDDLLTEVWGTELQIKDVSAIISRIANAPVLIQPERKEKIRELCPI